MSHLLEQKGALEHEVDRLKRENAEFSDKIMALELLVCNTCMCGDYCMYILIIQCSPTEIFTGSL